MKNYLHVTCDTCYLNLMKAIDLHDLKPRTAQFELSEFPNKKLNLEKFSLLVQIWADERFGKDAIKDIFENSKIRYVSEFVYFLLKEKEEFPTLESFQAQIATQQDRINIMKALFETIGISQPVLDKMEKEILEKKVKIKDL